MANGTVHKQVTKNIAIPYGVAIFFLFTTFYVPYYFALCASFFSVMGVYTTIWINPDLDHIEAVIRSKLNGSLIDKYWGLRWYLYGLFIPHRHWLSHLPIIGTMVRLIYYFPETYIVLHTLSMIIPVDDLKIYFCIFFFGMVVSDILHLCLDVVYSYFRL